MSDRERAIAALEGYGFTAVPNGAEWVHPTKNQRFAWDADEGGFTFKVNNIPQAFRWRVNKVEVDGVIVESPAYDPQAPLGDTGHVLSSRTSDGSWYAFTRGWDFIWPADVVAITYERAAEARAATA